MAQPDGKEWSNGVWRSAEREGERVVRERGGQIPLLGVSGRTPSVITKKLLW